jgi:hypothetical protein
MDTAAAPQDELDEVLGDKYPNLSADALARIISGKSLFVSRHRLRAGLSRDYARLVLMRACGFFAQLTGLSAHRFRLSAEERELLKPVINPKGPFVATKS